MEIFVGITGASGAPYARGLVAALLTAGHTVGVSFTNSGSTVVGHELYNDLRMPREEAINRFCGSIREDEFLQDELRDTPQPLKRRGFLGQP